MSKCRNVDGEYLLRSHLPSCRDRACAGCTPCVTDQAGDLVRHCNARSGCNGHLGSSQPRTCPQCIGRMRRALSQIEDLSALMLYAAIEANDEDSEPAMLAGPAADAEAWRHRYVSAMAGRIPPLDETDNSHPINVLGWWVLAFREDYNQPHGMVITVSSAVSYLKANLDKIAQDPEQDWAAFTGEVYSCRAHLEVVMATARITEYGTPCPDCREAGVLEPERLVKHYVRSDKSGASDYWACPTVAKHRWKEATYRHRVATDYVEHAEALTVLDLAARLEVPASTVRRWAGKTFAGLVDNEATYTEPRLKPCGRSHDGRRLYPVAVAKALADARAKRGA